ncbi:MAG: ATP-grasp domain-containing protein [Eubacterium sp.]|jgi:Carbamoylphosphate synthase large subunit (split gene in MJ)|nr:ATP-grasp domain-containing protein [Eubacterium sp.]
MKKYNVLVSGVGAIIGYGLIQSLKASKYDVHITGMDIYDDAYGRYVCDEFVQAVPAAAPEYPLFLKKLMEEKEIDLVMFGTEQEIYRLMDEREIMREQYKKLVINSREIVELSKDKWKTYEFLVKNGFQAIPTYRTGEFQTLAETLGLPFLLKPRRSYASKGIEKIHDREEFDFFRKRAGDQFMVQKIVGDAEHEYTVATFGFGDGTCIRPIMLKRKLSQEGATAKAWVTESEEVEQLVYQMAELLKPVGPTNFQFRYDNGKYLLLETNPRISSSTSIRTAFGYNEAQMCVEYFVEHTRPEDAVIKKGAAIRYIADYVNLE